MKPFVILLGWILVAAIQADASSTFEKKILVCQSKPPSGREYLYTVETLVHLFGSPERNSFSVPWRNVVNVQYRIPGTFVSGSGSAVCENRLQTQGEGELSCIGYWGHFMNEAQILQIKIRVSEEEQTAVLTLENDKTIETQCRLDELPV